MPALLENSRPDSTTPSQESRSDTRQTIPLPPRPWTKVIAAFACGVACTFLLTTLITAFSSTPDKPKTEVGIGKTAQRRQGAPPAKSEPTPPTAAKASDSASHAKEAPADRTPASDEPSAAPAAAANETADADAADKNDPCAQQTWPYVDHGCAGTKPNSENRSVRVISPDRSAPSTVTTTAPAQTSARPPRSTDGSATPAPTAKSPTSRETTGSSSPQVSLALQPVPPARTENATPAAVDSAAPKAKPETSARTEESTPSWPSSNEMVKRVPLESSPTAEDTRPKSRSRERHERRHEARKDRGKHDSREARDNRDVRDARDPGESREARDSRYTPEADDDEAPRARASQEEVSPRSRAANNNGSRERRSRAAANEDDDGTTVVHFQRMRDGRRATVYERPVEREAQETARERAPSTPFFFNPSGTGGY